MPAFIVDSTGIGNLRLRQAVRHADWPAGFYHASSSEMSGHVWGTIISDAEGRPMAPRPIQSSIEP